MVGAQAAAAQPVSAARRLHIRHGAGLRNGLFDMTFFGVENLARGAGLPPALSYAAAAALAVTLDFPLDAAVKRAMAAPMCDGFFPRALIGSPGWPGFNPWLPRRDGFHSPPC